MKVFQRHALSICQRADVADYFNERYTSLGWQSTGGTIGRDSSLKTCRFPYLRCNNVSRYTR